MIKRSNFRIYREERLLPLKKYGDGTTQISPRAIRLVHESNPLKSKNFTLKSKKKGNYYFYKIYEEDNLEDCLIKLKATEGELVCNSLNDYLKEILDIIICFENANAKKKPKK